MQVYRTFEFLYKKDLDIISWEYFFVNIIRTHIGLKMKYNLFRKKLDKSYVHCTFELFVFKDAGFFLKYYSWL